jgi:hypothetical protein
MKIIIVSLLSFALLPGLELKAEMLDNEDDTYLGLQLSIPLEEGPKILALPKPSIASW